MTSPISISLDVNGERVDAFVLPRLNLADFLREHLKLTGTHIGCEHGVCGACTVRVDGEIVRSCLMLAVQANNASVETIEGLSDSGEIADLQAAFRNRNALPMRVLHAGDADCGAGSVEADLPLLIASKFGNTFPVIIVAVPVIKRSSTPSNRLHAHVPSVPHDVGI